MKSKKQVIVIHGGDAWDTYEEYLARLKEWTYDPYEPRSDGWKKLLAERLGEEYEVFMPTMPSKYNAKYMEWCIWIEKVFPYIHTEAIMIGHSLGANFLAKYVAQHAISFRISQLHLVAGCYGLGGGFDLPGSLQGITRQCDHVSIYHSLDDPIVPYADAKKYLVALPRAELVSFVDRGHFLSDDFPEIIDRIKEVA